MSSRADRRGLGRGLSALMADVGVEAGPGPEAGPARGKGEVMVPVDRIEPNPDQPRRQFRESAMEELAHSIKERGIIQPLILRPAPEDPGTFQIVAGERRWRAAQMVQLHEVPAIVRELDDTEVLQVAIVENIQRADLNPIEEAAGYQQLMDRFGHTQQRVAEALGKGRVHVANTLRLLSLPETIRDMVSRGAITAGHARQLLVADKPEALAQRIVDEGLSVRETERLVKEAQEARSREGAEEARAMAALDRPSGDADTRALERDLFAALGLRVNIAHRPGAKGGKVTISYRSLDELDGLCAKLSR